jgi:uncharacterized protein
LDQIGIITDTSFWVALINDEDYYHAQAQRALAPVEEPLITTWPVVAETCYLLLERMGNHNTGSVCQRNNGKEISRL